MPSKTYVEHGARQTNQQQPGGMQLVKAYTLQMLMLHFADARNIATPSLREYIYKADPNLSKIIITNRGRFDPAKTGIIPALVLKKGANKLSVDLAYGGEVQGEMPLLGTPGVDPGREATAGGTTYDYEGECSFVVYCCHKEEAAAELLAEEVQFLLMTYRKLISTDLHLNDFLPAVAGEAGKMDEMPGEHWVVPVAIQVNYRLTLMLRPETPLFKGIAIRKQTAAGAGTLD